MKKLVKKPQMLLMLSVMLVFFSFAPMAAFADEDNGQNRDAGDGATVLNAVYDSDIALDVNIDKDIEAIICSDLELLGVSDHITKLSDNRVKIHYVATPSGNVHYSMKVKGHKVKADAELKFVNGIWIIGGTSCDNQNGNSGGNNTGGTTPACSLASLSGPELYAELKAGNKISVTDNAAAGKGVAHIKLPENCEIKLTLASLSGDLNGNAQVLVDSKTIDAKGDSTIEVNLPQFGPYQLVLLKGGLNAGANLGNLPANVVLDDSVVKTDLTPLVNYVELKVDNLCIPDVNLNGSFKVRNTNNVAIPFTWRIAGSGQTGTGTVDANGTFNFDTKVPGLATNGTVEIYVNGVLQATYTGNANSCLPNGGSTGGGTTSGGTSGGGSTGGTNTGSSNGGTTASTSTGTPGYTVTVIPNTPPSIIDTLANATVLPFQDTAVPNVTPGTDPGMTLADNTSVTPGQDTLTAADTTSQTPTGITMLPQTGESLPLPYYLVGTILILLGTLMIRARKSH